MAGGEASSSAHAIDALMEDASRALLAREYFVVVQRCSRALERALGAREFERMARICLPLQEARRQIRQLACDAGVPRLVRGPDDVPSPLRAGCFLLEPPMIGADARALREAGERLRVPLFVLTREPLTRDGRWPVVGVGAVSVRAKVPPPVPLERVEGRMTKDGFDGVTVPPAWFEAAAEALGDAATEAAPAAWPAVWRVEALLEGLSAVPEHEKLHQRLAEACVAAMHEPEPAMPRPSPHDLPYSF